MLTFESLALSEERRRQFVALRDGVGFDEQNDDEDFDGQAMDIDDVLRGDVEFDISHAGGEFQDQLRHEMNKPKYVLEVSN